MSRAEQDLLDRAGRPRRLGLRAPADATAPPGRGKFLIKVGGRPGIPVHVALTSVEDGLNDTNKRGGRPAQPRVVDAGGARRSVSLPTSAARQRWPSSSTRASAR